MIEEHQTADLTVIQDPEELRNLAVDINVEIQACEQSLRDSVSHALKAGELLLKAKSLCKHGTWNKWLSQNRDISERTAQASMRVANEFAEFAEANPQRVAGLSFRGLLKQLAKTNGDTSKETGIVKGILL